MSLTRTSGPAEEPGLYMDEAEAAAFRLAGGPSDTAKNPIQYFGNRGALAGHIDQVDKFIKRVPKLQLITAYDAVADSKGKTIYASDLAVHAAEAERELKLFAPSRAIVYTTTTPTPSVEMRSRAVDATLNAIRSVLCVSAIGLLAAGDGTGRQGGGPRFRMTTCWNPRWERERLTPSACGLGNSVRRGTLVSLECVSRRLPVF